MKWTLAKDKFLKDKYNKVEASVLAELIQTTVSSVRNRVSKLGLIKDTKLHVTEVRKRLRRNGLQLVGRYIGANRRHEVECARCHSVWRTKLAGYLNDSKGCAHCAGNFTLSIREINQRLNRRGLRLLSKYKGTGAPARFQCKLGHKWTVRNAASTLSTNRGCPKCAISGRADQNRLSAREVWQRLGTLGITLLSQYQNNSTRVKLKCGRGHVWVAKPVSIFSGNSGCPRCHESLFENRVRQIAEKITGWKFPKANPSDVPWLGGQHLDGYNRRHKIAIEPNGPQHYRPSKYFFGKTGSLPAFRKQQIMDKRKRRKCRTNGVHLVTIPYWIKDIEGYLSKRLQARI